MRPYFESGVDEPGGLHALLIGISDYADAGRRSENFGLGPVDGPALGVWRLCQLLMTPPEGAKWIRPVRTINLLLAPSEADLAAAPELAAIMASGAVPRPTFDNVRDASDAWRQRCDRGDDEAALFFFSGHGLRFKGADCLVCADFGIGNRSDRIGLDRCARFDSLFNEGMIGPRFQQGIARRQFWFVDACRVETSGHSDDPIGPPRDVLTPRLDDGRPIERPGLWSTYGAQFARAAVPGGLTPFAKALLAAIRSAVVEQISWSEEDAVEDVWPVTGNSVKQAVRTLLFRDPNAAGQVPTPMGQGGDEPILRFALDRPPTIQARISVRPPSLPTDISGCSLERADGPPPHPMQFPAIQPHPLPMALIAGTYLVEWTVAGVPRQKGWFATLGRDELLL